MEVTKYYCENCGEEVGKEQWTRVELAITFRDKYGGCPEKIHQLKKVCDKCIEGLGFLPTPEHREIREMKHYLSRKDKFNEVIRKIFKGSLKEN